MIANRPEARSDLPEPDRTTLAFAAKLGRTPDAVTADDVERLRAAGLSDEAILGVVQVVAYFSFVNRLALGLGVALE